MNDIDRFVLVEYDVRNGDPTSEENAITSPNLIRGMCAELMEAHDVMSRDEAIDTVSINVFIRNLDTIIGIGHAVDKMAWGDWLEVGRDKQDSDQRLYLVKVIDHEIEEIDQKWAEGKGGGW
jgi:hypothetical protein